MFVQEAEARFQQGLQQLARGHAREALPFISAAIERQSRTDATGHGQATYLSYHGLCLCLTRTAMSEGYRHCRRASEMDPCSADIWWNLGRAALHAVAECASMAAALSGNIGLVFHFAWSRALRHRASCDRARGRRSSITRWMHCPPATDPR